MRALLSSLLLLFAIGLAPALVAYAQQAEAPSQSAPEPTGEVNEEERSALLGFIEDKLSAPNRIIRLNGLRGSLSSNVALDSITIADKQGVWLSIIEPRLVWNRAALLGGEVEIERLTADRIDFPRQPLPDESAPSAEATPFAVPDLPVSVVIAELTIGQADFGQEVFGRTAKANLAGSVRLDGGELDLDMTAARLDAGGALQVKASFTGSPAVLDLNVALEEPADGIVANLLNLEGRPPVALTIAGQGPPSDLDIDLNFAASGETVLSGALVLDEVAAGMDVSARLSGPIVKVFPPEQRAFFGDNSRLEANFVLRNEGGVTVERVLLDSGSLQAVASARTTIDNFLSALSVDFRLVPTDGARIVLPGTAPQESRPSLGGATVRISYDAERQDGWNAAFSVQSVRAADLEIASLRLLGEGEVRDVNQPQQREANFLMAGRADGISSNDPAIAQAVGDALDFVSEGHWQAGAPLILDRLVFLGETFRLNAGGEFAQGKFNGSALLDANDLAAFSGLAARNLGGAIRLLADGSINPLSGIFDLQFDGTRATDLRISGLYGDDLFAGRTTISGGMARGENGIAFSGLTLANEQLNARLDGRYASDVSDLSVNARIADANYLTPQAEGAVSVALNLVGEQKPFLLNASIEMPSGRLTDRTVRGLRLAFDGTSDLDRIDGAVTGTGRLEGELINIGAQISASETAQALTDLKVEIGATNMEGSIARNEAGLLDGTLAIDSRDIGAIASLALVEASGKIIGSLAFNAADGRQDGSADVEIDSVTYGDARIASADVKADFTDLFGQARIDADLSASGLRAAGIEMETLTGDIVTRGERTTFDLDARLATQNARLRTSGAVERDGISTTITVSEAALTSAIANASLAAPVTVTTGEGATRISNARLNVGGGAITVNGSVAEELALDIRANGIPLALANAVAPGLDLSGTLSADATVTGRAGNPRVAFSVDGSSIGAAALHNNGFDALAVTVRGSFADNVVRLASAKATNAQGINITATGTAPLSGRGVDLNVEGDAPLRLAQRFLASRGTEISGLARVNAAVRGSLSDPQINGLASVSGATIFDPLSNLRLENVGLIAGLNGDRADIQRFNARLSGGGSVSLSGSVSLRGDFPADLRIGLDGARYTDGQTFSARASGQLALTGPMLSQPLVSGEIDLERVEILVPETIGGADDLLNVVHIAPPPDVAQTLARFHNAQGREDSAGPPVIVTLDVLVRAPNRIFVRGRGLDAELGGQVRVTGPITDIRPVGSFELRRGRLALLGRRIVLDEGSITLTGTLNPRLNFVARTRSGEVTAIIRITGRVSDLDVAFSSEPSSPDDEVLAQVIFGRSVGELSPFQIAQLAAAAAELTGGAAPGLVSGLRAGTGLDDLDVVADGDGNAAVRAGKYIADNVYLGVEAGSESRATINLDITDDLTARGAVGTEGDSEIGIFYERDY
jgi:translocation and assembly module TamB